MAEASQLVLGKIIRAGRTFTVRQGRYGREAAPVICKTSAEGSATAEALDRLENEFQITRGLDHPGQIIAIDRVQGPDGALLIFPDDGLTSLDQRDQAVLPPATVRNIALSVAATLDDLHGRGIVHRDVKPSNIVTSDDFETVKLIDFCMAMRTEDLSAVEPGAFLAQGTVAYMAPEQGGRANLRVDHRADLYAFGVVLYELLTGSQLFDDDDPAKVLHRHMTEMPPPPDRVANGVPANLSAAVMTLLRKDPGERFQTGAEFADALADGTGPVRFSVPDRLFGRDDILEKLGGQLALTAKGRNRVYRIAGPSGIGKSVLVQQIVAPAVAQGANFVHGKFDQLDRTRPYAPMVQAANQLLRRILSRSDEEVETWRARILDAVSPNGQVVLDLLPEYEALIGPQPRIARLGLNEARIRVEMVFKRFFQTLSRPEAPLIVFLDDLQWSDAASRDLMRLLMCDSEIRNFTFIAAYRDNEIGAAHPVTELFAELGRAGLDAGEAGLGPLDCAQIGAMTAETLGQSTDEVEELAELIWGKTGGNPFFVRQFLFALHRKGLIRHDAGRWVWDLDQIEAENITDNVADLVIDRIRDLPEATQDIVRIAACIGAEFAPDTLTLVTAQPVGDVLDLLEPAVKTDIVMPTEGESGHGDPAQYRFQHDRVQEAAVAMLQTERRAQTHASIGRHLLASAKPDTPDRHMVAIADHLIAGRDYLDTPERAKLHDLSLRAARRTKQANAWDAALAYLDVVSELQGADAWSTRPDQALFCRVGTRRGGLSARYQRSGR